MTNLVFHHDHQKLPLASDDLIPVQIYGLNGYGRGDISVIGNPIVDKIKRLGVSIPPSAIDFLSIALAVTAADTFVLRSNATDGWTRSLALQLPLYEPKKWQIVKRDLESALHFLTGDIWRLEFQEGGYAPPEPYLRSKGYKLLGLKGLDCISLFSGGLDSAVGSIDLIAQGRSPLLVSHAYTGDANHQEKIAENLGGKFSRFSVNANPLSATKKSDITMRSRSINFLAFGVIGTCAVQAISQLDTVDLIVPENGFISLNAPLTPRRTGTLSTRTTHPHFIASVQNIFDSVGIPCLISNPYQFKTKGEMISECLDRDFLTDIVDHTVSCSHWKRSHQQCGVCVPCIIRRASLHAGGISESTDYRFNDLTEVLREEDKRDDLMALSIAIAQRSARKLAPWISDSGPIPPNHFDDYKGVFAKGLSEVETYLTAQGVL